MTRHQRTLLTLALAAALADLATKALASVVLDDRTLTPPGPLDLRLSHNPGVAFGLGQHAPTWTILALTAAITLVLAVAGWRGNLAPPAVVGLILGGAAANLLDRLQAGDVIDMLDLGWWPSFNLADTFITVGATLLVLRDLTAPQPLAAPDPAES